MRYATRCVSTRVLPEPAPATTRIGTVGRGSPRLALHRVQSREQVRAVCSAALMTPASRYQARGSDSAAGFEAQLARRGRPRRATLRNRAQQLGAVLVQRDRERAGRLVERRARSTAPSRSRATARPRPAHGERDGSASVRCRRARCCGPTRSVPYAQPPVGGGKGTAHCRSCLSRHTSLPRPTSGKTEHSVRSR